jgi:hypothetical protein
VDSKVDLKMHRKEGSFAFTFMSAADIFEKNAEA